MSPAALLDVVPGDSSRSPSHRGTMRPNTPGNRRIDHRPGDAEHTVMCSAPPDRDQSRGRGANRAELSGLANYQAEADTAAPPTEAVAAA